MNMVCQSRFAPHVAMSYQRVMVARGAVWEASECDAHLPNMAVITLQCDGKFRGHDAKCLRCERYGECSPRKAGVLWLSWCRRHDIVVVPHAWSHTRIGMFGAVACSTSVCHRRVGLLAQ